MRAAIWDARVLSFVTYVTACISMVRGITYRLSAYGMPTTIIFPTGMPSGRTQVNIPDSIVYWLLESPLEGSKVKMHVSEMKIRDKSTWCYDDFLWIINGQTIQSDLQAVVCSSGFTVYNSTGRYMLVAYHSGPVLKTGIYLKFTFWRTTVRDRPQIFEEDEPMKLMLIAITGVILFIMFALVICFYYRQPRLHFFTALARIYPRPNPRQPRVIPRIPPRTPNILPSIKHADPPAYEGNEPPPSYSILFGDVTSALDPLSAQNARAYLANDEWSPQNASLPPQEPPPVFSDGFLNRQTNESGEGRDMDSAGGVALTATNEAEGQSFSRIDNSAAAMIAVQPVAREDRVDEAR